MPNLLRRALLAFAVAAMVFGCATAGANSELPPTVKRQAPTSPTHRIATRVRKPKPKPTLGERAAGIALRAVGVPYRWGGTSPASGFDCSGLVSYAFAQLGVSVPHSTYAIWGMGSAVSKDQLEPGDLVFFAFQRYFVQGLLAGSVK